MQVGVIVPNYSTAGTRENLELVARTAEDLGFDSIWTTDHVLMSHGQEEPYGHILEALMTLAYLAPFTRRVKLGVSVLVFPMRNPVLIAKEIATLDTLSGGRVILGLGAGWNEKEFAGLSVDFDNRGKRFNEAIQVLQTLWRQEDPRFDGQFTQFSEVRFSPRPVQAGGPPIWIGGPSKAALRRTATLADGWHPVAAGLDDFRRGMEEIRAMAGGRPITGSLRIRVTIGESLPEERSRTGQVRESIGGPANQVIDRIKAYEAAGLSHLVAQFGGSSVESMIEGMRVFARDVRPGLS